MSDNNAIQTIDISDTLKFMRAPKDSNILIRVTKAEHDAFQQGAEAEDQSMSDWFRRLGRKRLAQLGIEPPSPKAATKRVAHHG